MILGDVLYKWSFDGIILYYLELYDQQIAISKCHDSIYDRHLNGTIIAKRILWMGYYWPTMEHDCNDYVKKYVKYQ